MYRSNNDDRIFESPRGNNMEKCFTFKFFQTKMILFEIAFEICFINSYAAYKTLAKHISEKKFWRFFLLAWNDIKSLHFLLLSLTYYQLK